MIRQVVAGLVGVLAALAILSVGMWLQLRFTNFGAFIWTANHGTMEEVVQRFGDPLAITEKAVLFNTWMVSPIAALLSAVVARLIAHRTTWVMSITVAVPLAAIPLAAAFGVSAIAAFFLYILAAYGGMKAVDVAKRPQHALISN